MRLLIALASIAIGFEITIWIWLRVAKRKPQVPASTEPERSTDDGHGWVRLDENGRRVEPHRAHIPWLKRHHTHHWL